MGERLRGINRLVGMAVKASTSRADDPGSFPISVSSISVWQHVELSEQIRP